METSLNILYWFIVLGAIGFCISGLDDLFVDLYFYLRRWYRRMFVEKKYPKLTEEDLRKVPEKSVAILIPAWDEKAVIAEMLQNTLRWLDYRNYEIFVGTYPNDEATLMAVAEVQELEPRVHRIVCPHDGPTNKADCLNWALEGIRTYERDQDKKFEIIVIQDAEDIVHPLSLKLMNYLIPRVHMVQLPVIPLEMEELNFTAGTYLDEFAEFHSKDLLVRERMTGMIPAAGVGTAFSRECVDELALQKNNQLFNVETLTEDYDLGFRVKELNKKTIILQFTIERTRVVPSGWLRKREKLETVQELVATREFFPVRFRDAVRQKSRWILGIVFQGWQQIGWTGDAKMRYMLWRDRKALFSNFINIVGYLVVVTSLLIYFFLFISAETAPALVERGSWLWYLVVISTFLMVHRIVQRMVAVRRVSNWKQALHSIPRLIWGNILNFCAVTAATNQFVRWAMVGKPLTWEKTAHAFPTERQLREFRRKLGDLLLENRQISLGQLTHAMEVQKKTGGRLGDILTQLGYVSEEGLLPVLGQQLRVEVRRIFPGQVTREEVELIPERVAREHTMLVVGREDHTMVVAVVDPGNRTVKEWLDQNFPQPYRLVMAGQQNLLEALELSYGLPVRRRLMLGELLVQAGVINAEQLSRGLEEQKRTGKKLGEVLESLGLITPEVLAAKVREQQTTLPL